jgi:hypothetical protein
MAGYVKRLLVAVLAFGAIGIAAAAIPPLSASAAAATCSYGPGSCPTTSETGYVYAYDAGTNSFVPVPPSAAGNPGVAATYSYALSPACPQDGPLSNSSCAGAQQFCASTGSSGLHENVWRRQVEPEPTDWVIVGDVCIGTLPEPVPVRQVLADVFEYERINVPAPHPQVQPADGALVNLPVIVSVPELGPQAMAVRQPVAGRLLAVPSYSWSFDDGTVLTGAGRPYDGTDPQESPAHYLVHTYVKPETNASVTLVVTWRATFTAGGRSFAITPLTMSPIISRYPVYEAHSVLVEETSS